LKGRAVDSCAGAGRAVSNSFKRSSLPRYSGALNVKAKLESSPSYFRFKR